VVKKTKYRYPGALALIELHEQYLDKFYTALTEAEKQNLTLPQTTDPAYTSPAALLYHVLECARYYMVWICQQLDLPDPGIDETPNRNEIAEKAGQYIAHLTERWRLPLINVPEDSFYQPEYEARWGTKYCIDAMLEHAVMHPLRHEYQLRKMIAMSND